MIVNDAEALPSTYSPELIVSNLQLYHLSCWDAVTISQTTEPVILNGMFQQMLAMLHEQSEFLIYAVLFWKSCSLLFLVEAPGGI